MNKITLILGSIFVIAVLAVFGWQEGNTSGNKNVQGESTEVKVDVTVNNNDPVRGSTGVKVTIVEFSDFQCPYCGNVEPTLRKVLDSYGDKVKLVYKNYPLPSHENAENAALTALCAKEQGKYWEYHDKLFENQESLKADDLKKYAADLGLNTQDFNSCLENKKYKSQIETDVVEANRVGVRGTPAFFINGRSLYGAQPFEKFQEIIEEDLKK